MYYIGATLASSQTQKKKQKKALKKKISGQSADRGYG